MKKLPPLQCEGCGKDIPNRSDRDSNLCRKCYLASARCPDCGQYIANSGEHKCASVDLQPERYCIDCGKGLSNEGYRRWKCRCTVCDSKHGKAKERALRATLRESFGGVCQKCGYGRCIAALHFHHSDGRTEDERGKRVSLKKVREHPERFQLLCANCHIEVHLGVEEYASED